MPPHIHHRMHSRPRRNFNRSGRDNLFYLYEEPTQCYCNGIPCLCPLDVGALAEPGFLTVYPGWNVWDVWQVDDLPFSIMMIGVSADRQLRIWVEDAVRLGAAGANVADPIDLKGGQVEILNSQPANLKVEQRKEQAIPAVVVSGPATLKTVRFFNRGDKSTMVWPHDESYLLDAVYTPEAGNPVTTGPAPDTIGSTVGGSVTKPLADAFNPGTVALGVALLVGGYFILNSEPTIKYIKRKIKSRGK